MSSATVGTEKWVGILGGMGPEATVDLMQRIISATPARDDADHIRMLVDSNPKIPSRIKALIEGTGESPAPYLVDMARGLEKQGADFLVIPCNTAHHYHSEIAAAVAIPVVNLIELTAGYCKQMQPDLSVAGLLASSALQQINLYEPWLEQQDIGVLYPKQQNQQALMALIRAVKARQQTAEHILAYNRAANDLQNQGAECLIIACTELSVIGDRLETELPVYDASELLARAVVARV